MLLTSLKLIVLTFPGAASSAILSRAGMASMRMTSLAPFKSDHRIEHCFDESGGFSFSFKAIESNCNVPVRLINPIENQGRRKEIDEVSSRSNLITKNPLLTRPSSPDSDDIPLLNTGIYDVVVRSRQDVGKVDGLFVGYRVRDLQTIDVTDRDLDPFCLSSGVTSGLRRVEMSFVSRDGMRWSWSDLRNESNRRNRHRPDRRGCSHRTSPSSRCCCSSCRTSSSTITNPVSAFVRQKG